MKTTLMAIAMSLAASTAFGAVYTYDSSVANWYGEGGFTAAGNAAERVSTKDVYYGTNYQNQIYACGVADGVNWFQLNDWAGAEWTAPTNQIITKIEIAGCFRTDTRNETFGVFGGSTSADQTQYYAFDTGPTDGGAMIHRYSPITIEIAAADQVTMLQLRSLWVYRLTEYMPVAYCYGYPNNQDTLEFGNYNGRMEFVRITTEVIPEPATMALLGLGSLLLMSRKHA